MRHLSTHSAMAGRTTWSILSVQKSVKQEKSKEAYQSPVQDCQYWGVWNRGQVQSSLLNPSKVALHQAVQVISPTSLQMETTGGCWYPTPGLCQGSTGKMCRVTFLAQELCGIAWGSTRACVQPPPIPQRYFKPAPDCRASTTSSTKPECNTCANQVSWLREGKDGLERMPACKNQDDIP